MHANNRVFAYYDQIPANIYAHEMRSTYGKMTYAYYTCVIGRNDVRTVAHWVREIR